MSADDKTDTVAQDREAPESRDVGFAKPPRHSRFRPGQSGNPKGRPKGKHDFMTDLKATLKAPVKVTHDGRSKKVSTQAALLLRLRERALAGDVRSLDRLTTLAQSCSYEQVVAPAARSEEDAALIEFFAARVRNGTAGLLGSDDNRDDGED